jgi:dipeptide/tripeptide permease
VALGHVFTILAAITAGLIERMINQHEPNTVTCLWLIPQYFLISVAEVLLSVTLYEFAYTQAPESMKGLITGVFLLCVAIGNFLLVAVQGLPVSREYLNYGSAGLVAVILVVFIIIAVKYKYRDEEEEVAESEALNNTSNQDLV